MSFKGARSILACTICTNSYPFHQMIDWISTVYSARHFWRAQVSWSRSLFIGWCFFFLTTCVCCIRQISKETETNILLQTLRGNTLSKLTYAGGPIIDFAHQEEKRPRSSYVGGVGLSRFFKNPSKELGGGSAILIRIKWNIFSVFCVIYQS